MNGELPADWKADAKAFVENCRPTRPTSPAARRRRTRWKRSARCCRSSWAAPPTWRRAT
ncbi:hypothetical protein M5585_10490 [Serratia ureilytica]